MDRLRPDFPIGQQNSRDRVTLLFYHRGRCQVTHRMPRHRLVRAAARAAREHIRKARQRDVFIHFGLRRQRFHRCGRRGGKSHRRAEFRIDKIPRRLRPAEPHALGRHHVKRQKRPPHFQRIRKIRPSRVRLIMAETAPRQRPVRDHPLRCPPRIRESPWIPACPVKRSQPRDRQSVLPRINMLVHPRHSLLASRRIVQREILLPLLSRLQIRILARIKRPLRRGEKPLQEAPDFFRLREPFWLVPRRCRQREDSHVLRLERHDLLVVRMIPIAIHRVLVHAAPDRIDQLQPRRERLPRHLSRQQVPRRSLGHAILERIPVEEFLNPAPSPELAVIGVDEFAIHRRHLIPGKRRLRRGRRGRLLFDRWPGRRIVYERLKHRGHRRRRDVAPALRQFGPVPFENHCCRPAIVFVAVCEVGAGVLIYADGDIIFANKGYYGRI